MNYLEDFLQCILQVQGNASTKLPDVCLKTKI